MTWIRIDDRYSEHPKIAAVGPLGIALWLAGLAYCNRHLTDGRIPWTVARSLVVWQFVCPEGRIETIGRTSGHDGNDIDNEYVIGLLLRAGLWEEVLGAYLVHDYDQYQPSRIVVEERREATRSRVAAFRGRRCNSVTLPVTHAVTNGVVTPTPNSQFPIPNSQLPDLPPEPPQGGLAPDPAKAKQRSRHSQQSAEFTARAAEVARLVAAATGRAWRTPHAATRARLAAGATVEQLVLVAEHRQALWGSDPAMRAYVRPETVHAAGHWDSYLEAAEAWAAAGRPPPATERAGNGSASRPAEDDTWTAALAQCEARAKAGADGIVPGRSFRWEGAPREIAGIEAAVGALGGWGSYCAAIRDGSFRATFRDAYRAGHRAWKETACTTTT